APQLKPEERTRSGPTTLRLQPHETRLQRHGERHRLVGGEASADADREEGWHGRVDVPLHHYAVLSSYVRRAFDLRRSVTLSEGELRRQQQRRRQRGDRHEGGGRLELHAFDRTNPTFAETEDLVRFGI